LHLLTTQIIIYISSKEVFTVIKKWNTVQNSQKKLAYLYKDVYFLSMMNCKQTTQSFRDLQHKFLDCVIDRLEDKYEDHVKATRESYNEMLGSKHKNGE
jgi:hypothetical protein